MRPLVVIPTYNERANIARLIPAVFRALRNSHAVIVDDSSPDGTAKLARQLKRRYEGRLHLVVRPAKMGLGSAYTRGFRFALEHEGYDPVIQMDADGSHDPSALRTLSRSVVKADCVVGSRYCAGVRVSNWPWARVLLSLLANRYARMITGVPVTDLTGGFNAWRRRRLKLMNVRTLGCSGYAYQIELKHRCWRLGGRLVEVPITFAGRREGESKLSRNVVLEAVIAVWKMRFSARTRSGKV